MSILLVVLFVGPIAAALLCALTPLPLGRAVSVISGFGSLGITLALATTTRRHAVHALHYLQADALSTVFLLATALLYALVSVYTIGYLRGARLDTTPNSETVARHEHRYDRRLYAGVNLFAWAMLMAPLVNGFALLWIAVEITTVVSALLVALDGTNRATEAAWKYVLIASAGLGIALLGTILFYYAGAGVLGASYDLAFDPLLAHAASLPANVVRLGFTLAVLGFGTKVGFFPVHTWLPDAHSEAPTPVSTLLSGSLLAVSFYAVLRYFQVAVATLGPAFPRAVLLAFGIASLALAAFSVVDQRDLKRFLAYSSVEHMGILAIGMGFGTRLATVGVLLHVLAHAAAKGNAFMGAGALVRTFGTKSIGTMRDTIRILPWSASLFLLALLALTAAPPFGIFRSEFYIISGGLSAGHFIGVVALVALVTVAFGGLAWTATRLAFESRNNPSDHRVFGEPSRWLYLPPILGMAALLVLGVHPPASLLDLLVKGAAELGGGA